MTNSRTERTPIQGGLPPGRMWLGLAFTLLVGMAALAVIAFYVLGAISGNTLLVESEPDGASVLLNGRLAGATPLSIKGLSRGTYDLRLEKSGCTPLNKLVTISATGGAKVRETLSALELGALTVRIMPTGAEVLLDGEMAGHTPLSINNIPAGPHELLVRKTNFSSYSKHIEIQPHAESKFDGIELTDKILETMEGNVKAEPQRVGHYIDLAHYYFVNHRMEDAANTFLQGKEVLQTPLDFSSGGYPGKDKMSPEEIAVELRLRREDDSRFDKELTKHKSFQGIDNHAFLRKLAEGADFAAGKNRKSWPRAREAALDMVAHKNYERAALIYQEHIRAAPDSPDLSKAYTALIEVYCMNYDVNKAVENFNQFLTHFAKDGVALRAFGNTIYPYFDRFKNTAERDRVLAMAEKALRTGLELPCDPQNKSAALYDLGSIFYFQERYKDSVTFMRQSVDLTEPALLHEERQVRLADTLRKSGDKAGALELYNKLKDSESTHVRESANYGLISLRSAESKQ